MWWTVIWPSLAGTMAAVVVWLLRRSRPSRANLDSRLLTTSVAGTAALVVVMHRLLAPLPLYVDVPSGVWEAAFGARYVLPLVLGLIAVLLLGVPDRRRRASSGADLTPRTWRSYIATGWLGTTLATLVVVIGLSLAAGFASEPDDQGRHVRYTADFGSASVSTEIYGWHVSAVPLVVLALTLATGWRALTSIARRPPGADVEVDSAARRLRSTNVARMTLGAVLLHLQSILHSLAATSSVRGTMSTTRGEYFSSGTAFSALTEFLQVSGTVVGIVGLGLWVFTALTGLSPAVRSPRVPVAS